MSVGRVTPCSWRGHSCAAPTTVLIREQRCPGRHGIILLVIVHGFVADFAGGLLDRHADEGGRLDLLVGGWPDQLGAPGEIAIDEAIHRRCLLGLVLDDVCFAVGHHRAVVDRVVKAATGKHDRVGMRDGETNRNARGLGAQHPAGRRTMPIEVVAFTPERGGGAVGLPVNDIGDVADQSRVENVVYRCLVVLTAGRTAHDSVAPADLEGWSGRGIGHDSNSPQLGRRQESAL